MMDKEEMRLTTTAGGHRAHCVPGALPVTVTVTERVAPRQALERPGRAEGGAGPHSQAQKMPGPSPPSRGCSPRSCQERLPSQRERNYGPVCPRSITGACAPESPEPLRKGGWDQAWLELLSTGSQAQCGAPSGSATARTATACCPGQSSQTDPFGTGYQHVHPHPKTPPARGCPLS